MFRLARLTTARAASAAALVMTLASCSLILDWDTYSADYDASAQGPPTTGGDGDTSSSEDATSGGHGDAGSLAHDGGADGANGAIDGEVSATADGSSVDATTSDAAPSDGSAGDGSPADAQPDVQGDAPSCTQSCKGCCNALGECAFGTSNTTCGSGGEGCMNCVTMDLACVNNACAQSTTVQPPPTCVPSQCSLNVCIPVWEGTCCKADNTCGCQPLIPPGPCL